jgi:hypothetical protein
MNLLCGRVVDFDTGAKRIRVTLTVDEFYSNGSRKRFPVERDPEMLVVDMPLACAEPFHLGQFLAIADPSLIVHEDVIEQRRGRYNEPSDPPITVTRSVEKFLLPVTTVRDPGFPRPWEKRADTEYALLKTRYEGALTRIESLELELTGIEQLRATEAREAEERLRASNEETEKRLDERDRAMNGLQEACEELYAQIDQLKSAHDGLLSHGTALRGEILTACGVNGDDADPLVEVRRVVRERDEARNQLQGPTLFGHPVHYASGATAVPIGGGQSSVVGAATENTSMLLAEANYQLKAVREALRAPPEESIVAIAQQRMTKISDLVARIDTHDRNIAEALAGMHPGLSAADAVRKLVEQSRSQFGEQFDQDSVIAGNALTPVSKTHALAELPEVSKLCPIGVYRHRKGGVYVVYGHSVNEATLRPLVHYYAMDNGSRWTRTILNFTEIVDGRPRFERFGDVSDEQLRHACGIDS